MTDKAAFREGNIFAVYGTRRLCFQTARPHTFPHPVDPHHILGRNVGKIVGEPRETSSSIFNLAWLRRDIHEGPLRDADDQRRVYLRVACQHVMNAVGTEGYTLNDPDKAFIRLIRAEYTCYADIYQGIAID